MTLMDAIRAEVEDWSQHMSVRPSDELLAQFYSDSLGGGTADELAEVSIQSVLAMVGPTALPELPQHMALWCSAVLLGVRAAKRAEA